MAEMQHRLTQMLQRHSALRPVSEAERQLKLEGRLLFVLECLDPGLRAKYAHVAHQLLLNFTNTALALKERFLLGTNIFAKHSVSTPEKVQRANNHFSRTAQFILTTWFNAHM